MPVDRRDVDMDCNRTSEDSGLTSGDNADSSAAGGGTPPPAEFERLLCCSTNSLRTNKHVYATCLPLRERNKAKMLVDMHSHGGGGGGQSPRGRCGKATGSLPRDRDILRQHPDVSSSSSADSSPSDEKPIPTPRKSKAIGGGGGGGTATTRAYLLEPDILTVERDSLEPDGEYDYEDEEIFDEPDVGTTAPARSLLDITESMCNLVVDQRDPRHSSLTNDAAEYVNLAEIYTLHRRQLPGPPPAPPVHRSMAPWVGGTLRCRNRSFSLWMAFCRKKSSTRWQTSVSNGVRTADATRCFPRGTLTSAHPQEPPAPRGRKIFAITSRYPCSPLDTGYVPQ